MNAKCVQRSWAVHQLQMSSAWGSAWDSASTADVQCLGQCISCRHPVPLHFFFKKKARDYHSYLKSFIIVYWDAKKKKLLRAGEMALPLKARLSTKIWLNVKILSKVETLPEKAFKRQSTQEENSATGCFSPSHLASSGAIEDIAKALLIPQHRKSPVYYCAMLRCFVSWILGTETAFPPATTI